MMQTLTMSSKPTSSSNNYVKITQNVLGDSLLPASLVFVPEASASRVVPSPQKIF